MLISKRRLLYAVGGAGAALVGSWGFFAATRTPVRAYQAWRDIDTEPPQDVRLDAFRYAILAPSPHNRQPWLIELVGHDRALVRCDLSRRLPMTDPFDRQTVIGFGCFLELARIAAAERGVRVDIEPFPDGQPGDRLDARPIAAMRFVADAAVVKDSLFPFIASRRSNKRPYDMTLPVTSQTLQLFVRNSVAGAEVKTSDAGQQVQSLRALSWDAWLIELNTSRTWQETVDLMRIGKAEIENNPDGVSIGGATLEILALAGQLSRAQMTQPGTMAYNTAITRYQPVMASGMAYGWIVTDGNTRLQQLSAGYSYVRMNLEASRLGLGFHPISQALQEFTEMDSENRKVHSILGAKTGQRVQMLVRLGYGNATAATPRWSLRDKLTGA
jgi:hypothetical protein